MESDRASCNPMEEYLSACVKHSLSLFLHSNAVFLCERLVAEFPTEENLVTLGNCYLRSNEAHRTYQLLKGLQGAESRYVFALACVELGKLAEAEGALLLPGKLDSVPRGGAGLYLLGRVLVLSNRHAAAVAYFSASLRSDPTLWCAFEALCSLGAFHEAQEYADKHEPTFSPRGGSRSGDAHGTITVASGYLARERDMHDSQYAEAAAVSTPGETETLPGWAHEAAVARRKAATRARADKEGRAVATFPHHPSPASYRGVPRAVVSDQDTPMSADASPTLSPPDDDEESTPHEVASLAPKITPTSEYATPAHAVLGTAAEPPRHRGIMPPTVGRHGGRPATSAASTDRLSKVDERGSDIGYHQVAVPHRKFVDEGKIRKVSGNLFGESDTELRLRGGEKITLMDATSPEAAPENAAVDLTRWASGRASTLELLRSLSRGALLLAKFQCREAVEEFQGLPSHQYATGWVLSQVGRALYEIADYQEAERAFQASRRVDGSRLKDLDIYSTVLWHLRREVELAHLSQEVVALDRQSPVVWCILGNCFSLQKDKDTAIRFFQRALQLDPTFAYAYTLSGHEYFASDDLGKALTCYRNAIRIDPRHYNAWFGSGQIYLRQQKYAIAEHHFRQALAVNGASSVLWCFMGTALTKLGRKTEGLRSLKAAVVADPRNPLARFNRAVMLSASARNEEALEELVILQDIAPREPAVLFLMGRIMKKMGRLDEAMACFSSALDLQPPSADSNRIRSAMENLQVAEDDAADDM